MPETKQSLQQCRVFAYVLHVERHVKGLLFHLLSAEAWQELSDATIRNCWRKSGILPVVWQADISSQDVRQTAKAAKEAGMGELASLIGKLNLGDDALPAEEYIELQAEKQTEAEWTDQQLVAIAAGGDPNAVLAAEVQHEEEAAAAAAAAAAAGDDEPDVNDLPPRAVPLPEARRMASELSTFLSDNSSMFS
jgi:hypothetical protein